MAKSEADLITGFTEWLKPLPGSFSDYYVGVAADPKDRLKNGHGVDTDAGAAATHWRYDTAFTSDIARRVEQHFIAQRMQGGPGGGDATSTAVYIYKTTASTRE